MTRLDVPHRGTLHMPGESPLECLHLNAVMQGAVRCRALTKCEYTPHVHVQT